MQGKLRHCLPTAGKEFKKFSSSLVGWFYFNGTILTVIALDALCIGLQASEYITTKAGQFLIANGIVTGLGPRAFLFSCKVQPSLESPA